MAKWTISSILSPYLFIRNDVDASQGGFVPTPVHPAKIKTIASFLTTVFIHSFLTSERDSYLDPDRVIALHLPATTCVSGTAEIFVRTFFYVPHGDEVCARLNQRRLHGDLNNLHARLFIYCGTQQINDVASKPVHGLCSNGLEIDPGAKCHGICHVCRHLVYLCI